MRWKSTILIIFIIGLFLSILIKLPWIHHTPAPPFKPLTPNTSNPCNIIKKLNKLDLQRQTIVVTRGDTLADIFNRLKINQEDLLKLLKQNELLTVLYPHTKLVFQTNAYHQLMALQYPLSTATNKILIFIRQGNNFIKKMKIQPLITTTLSYKSIVIQHSLIQDAKNLV